MIKRRTEIPPLFNYFSFFPTGSSQLAISPLFARDRVDFSSITGEMHADGPTN